MARTTRTLFATYAACALMCTFMSAPAAATLGEKDSSVETLRQTLGAQRHEDVAHAGYVVHEVTTENGLTLREYAGSDGVIFGVAWEGITHPDLAPILGTYLDDYSAALQKEAQLGAHGRHVGRATGSRVVVLKSGHMRAVRGKAYIPSLLPAEVTADDIK